MLNTSGDVLRIVFAVCVVALTVFLCFTLYYLLKILRDFNRMTASVRSKLELVDKILNLVKDKLETGASHLGLIADAAIKMVGYFIDHQQEKPRKRGKD